MSTKIWLFILGLISSILALWLLVASLLPTLAHGQLLGSLLFTWLALIFSRALKDSLWPQTETDPYLLSWLRYPLNVLLSLLPGLALSWFALFAPGDPTLTRGGYDVCSLETGFCLSGPRAIIIWGVLVTLIGLGFVWLLRPTKGQNRPSRIAEEQVGPA